MKTKALLLLMSLLFLKEKSNAQLGMGKVEDIKKLQTMTLVVVLRKENPSTVKSLSKKPNELKNYRLNIEKYNKEFKLAMDSFWFYKQELKYVELPYDRWDRNAKKELEKELNSKEKDYAYIMQTASNYSFGTYDMEFYHRDVTGLKLSDLVVGFGDKSVPVGGTKLPFVDPSEADFIYGIQQIKTYFDFRLTKAEKSRKEAKAEYLQNAVKLKEKTLLVDKALLQNGLTEKEIKTVYPYLFKITDRAEIDQAIINRDDKYAYVQVVAIGASTAGRRSHGEAMHGGISVTKSSLTFFQYVIDAKDGSMLGYAGGGVKLAGFSGGDHEIKKKHFEDYSKLVKDSENK